ncbi:beta-1,3-glucan-binding protein-like isoform X2 [Condylostylus longicornis]|uniref:beta-1,3-glucan-binding protein-like isoform X2 n=1 Tax=Condylostylus longicornis TaxID=2530218 RepID=UPI00244E25FD|nr:beta-1,3-glucan-binding protein-like isoform X2 [Condylostylus longicornis]
MLLKYLIVLILSIQLSLSKRSNNRNINSYNKGYRCTKSRTVASGSKARYGPYCSGQLIFKDDFDTFDFEKWQHENTLAGGGNWEFQWYTNNRSNSFTKEGKLHIRPTLTSDAFGEEFLTSGLAEIAGGAPADQCTNPSFFGCTRVGTKTHVINPVRSARIRTVESFNFKYGRLEVRAKVPTGDWLWPAIWLLPKRNAYGTWPASGEIDLLESRGNRELYNNGVNIGVEQYGTTLHYGPDPNYNGWKYAHFVQNARNNEGFNKDFHKYTLEWTPEYMKFYLDDVETGTFNAEDGFFKRGKFPENIDNPWQYSNSGMAPFDQEFYIIINLAVGGTNGYFPDSAENPNPKPWLNSSPHALTDFWDGRSNWLSTWNYDNKTNNDRDFQIDYVRVYAL